MVKFFVFLPLLLFSADMPTHNHTARNDRSDMESAISISGANRANPDRAETCVAQASAATLSSYADGHEALGYDNVLREIITDEQYRALRQMGVLNEKALRDAHIRKTFKELRAQRFSAHQSIERLQTLYPYLQFDTLRKIVYQIS